MYLPKSCNHFFFIIATKNKTRQRERERASDCCKQNTHTGTLIGPIMHPCSVAVLYERCCWFDLRIKKSRTHTHAFSKNSARIHVLFFFLLFYLKKISTEVFFLFFLLDSMALIRLVQNHIVRRCAAGCGFHHCYRLQILVPGPQKMNLRIPHAGKNRASPDLAIPCTRSVAISIVRWDTFFHLLLLLLLLFFFFKIIFFSIFLFLLSLFAWTKKKCGWREGTQQHAHALQLDAVGT